MSKFIFVCYNNGCGGEQLAVKISQLDECEPLEFTRRGKRTIAHDAFKSGLVSVLRKKEISPPNTDLWQVAPAHISPDELVEDFPDSVFVVINMPITNEQKRTHILRKYRYFDMSINDTLQQRVGEYIDRGGDLNDKQKVMKLAKKPMSNLDIRCLAKGVEPTKENRRRLFFESIPHKPIEYKHASNVIEIDFIDVYNNNIESLLKKLQELIKGK